MRHMYYIAYVVSEEGPPEDGQDVATTTGWFDFGTWILDRHEQFPELAHLAQEGWNEGADALDAMEHECEQVMHGGAGEDLAAIAGQILAGLRSRPQATTGVIVTDGEEGGGEDADQPA